MPGFFLSGSGHWVAGERRTGYRLLALKGIGLGAFALGGTALFATGASRRISGPTVAVLVGASALWFVPWLADIYGVATRGTPTGEPRLALPRLELDAGWAYVRDPQFAYDQFAFVEGELGLGAFRIRPLAWVAVGADNQRFRLETVRRLRGPGSARGPVDGSFLEIGGAGSYHRYGDDAFDVIGVELFAAGRLDMSRIGRTLTGSFADAALGVAWERVGYSVEGASADYNDLLIARFGYGIYLGGRGELALHYDHRRDGYAQGLSPSENNGSGFLGSVGAGGFFYVTPTLGVGADYTMGSAHVARLSLRVQLGGKS